jgi:hypothetical protein
MYLFSGSSYVVFKIAIKIKVEENKSCQLSFFFKELTWSCKLLTKFASE